MSDPTRPITLAKNNEEEIKASLLIVYNALKEKGYDPISQIVGYILSEDPAYITTHNNARNIIRHIDKYDLLNAALADFLKNDCGK